jgi:hypothetical protein
MSTVFLKKMKVRSFGGNYPSDHGLMSFHDIPLVFCLTFNVPMAGFEPARALTLNRFSYQLQLSLPTINIVCGLDFIFTILQVPSVKSLHVPFQASLGIAILKVSPNLKGSTSTVSHRALIFYSFQYMFLFENDN